MQVGEGNQHPLSSSPIPLHCHHSGAPPIIPPLPWFLPNTALSPHTPEARRRQSSISFWLWCFQESTNCPYKAYGSRIREEQLEPMVQNSVGTENEETTKTLMRNFYTNSHL